MFVNQGEEELEEGQKARKMVKAMKTKTKAYAKAIVLLVLRIENCDLKSEIKVPPLMGAYFVISAIWAESYSESLCNFKNYTKTSLERTQRLCLKE
ncbi:hypothetical protein CDL12_29726 [Handroanthus impetiginosus]|uniref:Uncharacterized protein n=1 Tax=Handroanthus impetiginosus TaxID=429701 RepID=A0A2G9FXL4_9LAMI|nr:hypothetical protein CDL12_29726 [Handroanthus impetiginosus]